MPVDALQDVRDLMNDNQGQQVRQPLRGRLSHWYPLSLPVLNCYFLIFSASSIPEIVTTALFGGFFDNVKIAQDALFEIDHDFAHR